MKISDAFEFFDLKTPVFVHTNYGTVSKGIIVGVDNDFDTESGEDEIELDVGADGYTIAIELPDIVKIEKAI